MDGERDRGSKGPPPPPFPSSRPHLRRLHPHVEHLHRHLRAPGPHRPHLPPPPPAPVPDSSRLHHGLVTASSRPRHGRPSCSGPGPATGRGGCRGLCEKCGVRRGPDAAAGRALHPRSLRTRCRAPPCAGAVTMERRRASQIERPEGGVRLERQRGRSAAGARQAPPPAPPPPPPPPAPPPPPPPPPRLHPSHRPSLFPSSLPPSLPPSLPRTHTRLTSRS